MIFLLIALWIVAGFICAGAMIAYDREEWGDTESAALAVYISLCTWPLLLFILLAIFIFKKLGYVAEFIGGFLYALFKKKDDDSQ